MYNEGPWPSHVQEVIRPSLPYRHSRAGGNPVKYAVRSTQNLSGLHRNNGNRGDSSIRATAGMHLRKHALPWVMLLQSNTDDILAPLQRPITALALPGRTS